MISINQLTVSLAEKTIINNLSLSFASGTVQVLMGPNGSGKSTLAYTLMGHPRYSEVSGSVIINGEDILSLPVEKRARKGMFLACQYPQEVPGVTVIAFLTEAYRMLHQQQLSVKDMQEKIYAALDMVKLDHNFAYRYVNEGFSGGEKKRFEIVQMLVLEPSIVILDEIDSGLDVDALKLVGNAIRHMRTTHPQTTFIIITHYLMILQYITPDQVHILVNGSLAASGNQELAERINEQGYHGL